ncbi:hypothetical protein D9M70_461120 [compost metagenome]
MQQPLHARAHGVHRRRLAEVALVQVVEIAQVLEALLGHHRDAGRGVQHQPLDALRIARREHARHPAAQGLAGDMGTLDAQHVHDLGQQRGIGGRQVVDVGALLGQAVSDEIDCHHMEVVAEGHHVLGIGLDVPADAVQQQQRLGVALAGLGDADTAEARGMDIANLGAEKI